MCRKMITPGTACPCGTCRQAVCPTPRHCCPELTATETSTGQQPRSSSPTAGPTGRPSETHMAHLTGAASAGLSLTAGAAELWQPSNLLQVTSIASAAHQAIASGPVGTLYQQHPHKPAAHVSATNAIMALLRSARLSRRPLDPTMQAT